MSAANFPDSNLQIRPASFNDIPFIQFIASQTWPIAYKSILTEEQLSYMLERFYSTDSLTKQLHDNHHFFLALKDYAPVGFASFSHENSNIFKLQKLYVLPGLQKSGTGKIMLQTIIDIVRSMGGTTLLLNVNRNNPAVHFYKKIGFAIIQEEDIAIGKGYFMNDFIMALELDKG